MTRARGSRYYSEILSTCAIALGLSLLGARAVQAHDSQFDQFDTYVSTTGIGEVLAFCNADAGRRQFCIAGLGDLIETNDIDLMPALQESGVCWPTGQDGKPDTTAIGGQVLDRLNAYRGDPSTWAQTIIDGGITKSLFPCL